MLRRFPTTRPSRAWCASVEQPGRDLRALLARVAAVRLDRQRALVVRVERMLPGEADAAEHLDRPFACRDGRVAGIALRRGHGDRRLLVVLRDAPGSPVRERACEL